MTKTEVTDRIVEFIDENSEAISNSIKFTSESDTYLYFKAESVDGLNEEIRIRKDDGTISTSIVGEKDWYATGVICDCFRACTECKQLMVKGYVIENGAEYFCSDEHLTKTYLMSEYLDLHKDGDGDSYWKEW